MTAKIDILREAFEENQAEWKQYENDCHQFTTEFRQQLAEYLECETQDIQLVQLPKEFKPPNLRKVSGNRRVWLDNDANWHFMMQFVLEWIPALPPHTHQKEPNKWLTLPVTVRPMHDNSYHVIIPPDGSEFDVSQNDFSELVEFTFTWLRDFLANQFQDFLKGKADNRASIGFPTPTD